jgi:Ca2+-binding EF-hand superfamily protein
LTSRGNLRDKLEYSFKLYDADGNGYLDKFELKQVLDAMLILLDVDKSKGDSDSIAN